MWHSFTKTIKKFGIWFLGGLVKWIIRRNLFATLINAILITALGVYLSLYASQIEKNSRNFLSLLSQPNHWSLEKTDILVLIFWILQFFSIIWIVCFLYSQTHIEKQKVADNRKFIDDATVQIQAAIHTAPNPEVFLTSLLASFYIDGFLKDLDIKISKRTVTKNDFQETIMMFLRRISSITQSFNPLAEAAYCINVMPYIQGSGNTKNIKTLVKAGNLLLINENDLKNYYIRGVLEGREDLRYEINRKEATPIVNLPIFKSKATSSLFLLPGACTALVSQENVVPTTDFTVSNDFDEHIPAVFWEKLKVFFEGPGRDIRSIVSFVIPHPNYAIDRNSKIDLSDNMEAKILAVLNIDCNKEQLIGGLKAYHTTYFSLIWPIIFKLAPYLDKYLNYEKYFPGRK